MCQGVGSRSRERRGGLESRPLAVPHPLTPTPLNKHAIIKTCERTLGAIMPNENSYEVALQKSNAIREGLTKTPEK